MPKREFGSENGQEAISGTQKRRKTDGHDALSPEVGSAMKSLAPNAYTVGWICAIATEYVAAQQFLDEKHGRPLLFTTHNNNDYTFGRAGNHNVVIAILGGYGATAAASTATDLLHNFPNVRIGLMVGIGGGAPSRKHDIRLGDIVISSPRDGEGGIFQYDLGKTIQDQTFRMTGFLNQPPMFLQTAVTGLKAQYESDGHCLQEAIADILNKNPRLWPKYKRPDPDSDRLYVSRVVHPPFEEASCAVVCGDDPSDLVRRAERSKRQDNPAVHYGLIASANQVMKDAVVRDTLAAEKDVLCFEMEAAGLMNHFPCLVIRGICDYSDSHKNKDWQGYAAMAAAAYAKDILNRISPYTDSGAPAHPMVGGGQSINGTRKEGLVGSLEFDQTDAHPTAQVRKGDCQPLDEEQKQELLNSLRFDQIDARQMTIKAAHAKTCEWLLQAPEYIDWCEPCKLNEHHGFLWIKGKPGTGKSTLMKFALVKARKKMKDKTVISFFFNARGDNLEKTTVGMYQSLLLQLLERHPDAQKVFDTLELVARSGRPRQWSVESLKELFQQAVQGLGKSSLVCFIDALDECDENQIRGMVLFFEHMGELTISANIGFLVCFSSRHYPHITLQKGLSLVLEGHEGHSQDINSYLSSVLKIGYSTAAKQIRFDIQEKASGVFLWVVLVVEILNKEYDRGRVHALRTRLRDIPGDLHELFRDILTRDQQNRGELLLCIQWVLFAREPLKPEQLYFAILSGVEPEFLSRWDSEEITASVTKRYIVDSSKGLAEVTRSKNPTVQFIHESVRDFLLKENGLEEIWSDLGGNFQGESQERLKQCCLNYINIDIYTDLSIGTPLPKASSQQAAELRQLVGKMFPFLEYAVQNILYHANAAEGGAVEQTGFLEEFRLADWIKLANLFERHDARQHTLNASFIYILAEHNMGNLIMRHPSKLSCFRVEDERYGLPMLAALATDSGEAIHTFLKAQSEIMPSTSPLYRLCERYQNRDRQPSFGRNFTFSRRRSVLLYLIEKGDEAIIVAYLLATGKVDIESRDRINRTPLSWAAVNGHKVVVQLLMETGKVDVDAKDNYGRTPLSLAAEKGHETIVQLLLETGKVDVDAKDKYGQSPLSQAAEQGHEAVVQLLLETGKVDVKAKDDIGQSSLSRAAEKGHEAVVQLFLETGKVDVEAKDDIGQTPLSLAAVNGHEAVVQLLLETDKADVEAKDKYGKSPLMLAAERGHEAVVQLLLETGKVDVEARDDYGRTPLPLAAVNRHEAVVQLLLETGKVDVEAKDNIGRTPLSWAAEKGHETIARLLVEMGKVDVEAGDDYGRTPLFRAAEKGYEAVVQLLLETGKVDVEAKDEIGRTPLSLAAVNGHETVVQLLLETGKVDVKAKDKYGQSPLSRAAEKGHEAIVQLLMETGKVDVDAKDNYGGTPLSLAAEKGHETVVQLLLETGKVDVEAKDDIGQTPLSRAAEKGHEAVVRLLVEMGKNIGRTPLSLAAVNGHEAVVRLLVETGKADVEAKDKYGQSPLSLAAEQGHEAVIKLLLTYLGVSSSTMDDSGRTLLSWTMMYRLGPLFWAAEKRHEAVVQLLLDMGNVDVEAEDNMGRTPLSWAAEKGHETIARLLVETGKVDVEARDDYGRTPLSWAAEKGHETIVQLLVETGKADIEAKDNIGQTPLSRAAVNGHEAVINLLQRSQCLNA